MFTTMPKPRLLYISCAPRVSLRPTAENLAARNHIKSVIDAFRSNAFKVNTFILGDILPSSFSDAKSQEILTKSNGSRLISDLIRIAFRIVCQPLIFIVYALRTDVVYERFGSFQAGGYLLKLLGKTWILESNAILYEESFHESKSIFLWRLARYFERRAYRSCDVLVCVSESLKNGIVNQLGVSPKKILVLKNAVNTDFFVPNEESRSLEDKVVIGYVGSLVKWQSLDILISALSQVKKDLREKLQLVIVGDGPERRILEDLVEDLDVAEQVIFEGRVPFEQIPAMIDTFDVGYCFPKHDSTSSSESFNSPMKLYEYLSMGKPVLCSLNEDLQAMEDFESFSFLINENEELPRKLEALINCRTDLKRMGQKARHTIQSKHSWQDRIGILIDHAKLRGI